APARAAQVLGVVGVVPVAVAAVRVIPVGGVPVGGMGVAMAPVAVGLLPVACEALIPRPRLRALGGGAVGVGHRSVSGSRNTASAGMTQCQAPSSSNERGGRRSSAPSRV